MKNPGHALGCRCAACEPEKFAKRIEMLKHFDPTATHEYLKAKGESA